MSIASGGSPYIHLAQTDEQQALLERIQWAVERFTSGAFASVAQGGVEGRKTLRNYSSALRYALEDEVDAVAILSQSTRTPGMQRKLDSLVARYASEQDTNSLADTITDVGFNEKPLLNMIRDGDAPPLVGEAPIATTGTVVDAGDTGPARATEVPGAVAPSKAETRPAKSSGVRSRIAPPVINLGSPDSDGRNPGEFAIIYAKEARALGSTYSIWSLMARGSMNNPGSYISPDLINEDLLILADINCGDKKSASKWYIGSVRQLVAVKVRDFLNLDSSNNIYLPSIGGAGKAMRLSITNLNNQITRFEHVRLVIDGSRVDQRFTRSYSIDMAKSFRPLTNMMESIESLQPSADMLQVVMNKLRQEL